MKQTDAYKLLADELSAYRAMSFDDLCAIEGLSTSQRHTGPDGTQYIVDVAVRWVDDQQVELIGDASIVVAGIGPLRRLDRSSIASTAGIRAV